MLSGTLAKIIVGDAVTPALAMPAFNSSRFKNARGASTEPHVLIMVTILGSSACRKTTALRLSASFLTYSNWSKTAYQVSKSLTGWVKIVYADMISPMIIIDSLAMARELTYGDYTRPVSRVRSWYRV